MPRIIIVLTLAAVLAATSAFAGTGIARSDQAEPVPEELYSGPEKPNKTDCNGKKLNLRGVRTKGSTDVGPIDMLGTAGQSDKPVQSDQDASGGKLPE